jgi:hypothetical protein
MSDIVAGVVAQPVVVQKMHKSIFGVRPPDQRWTPARDKCLSSDSRGEQTWTYRIAFRFREQDLGGTSD